jgi:hypothetical protein
VTVVKTGALFTPRLSVTTSEKVTVPEVLGTVTETLEVGAVVVTEGFVGESGVELEMGIGTGTGMGVGIGTGCTGIGPGCTGVGTGCTGVGSIGVGLTIGVTGPITGAVTASGLLLVGLFGVGIFFLLHGTRSRSYDCTRLH